MKLVRGSENCKPNYAFAAQLIQKYFIFIRRTCKKLQSWCKGPPNRIIEKRLDLGKTAMKPRFILQYHAKIGSQLIWRKISKFQEFARHALSMVTTVVIILAWNGLIARIKNENTCHTQFRKCIASLLYHICLCNRKFHFSSTALQTNVKKGNECSIILSGVREVKSSEFEQIASCWLKGSRKT